MRRWRDEIEREWPWALRWALRIAAATALVAIIVDRFIL